MIPVTKPYLPKRERLDKYIDEIYGNHRLTNNGPLVNELTERLADYLAISRERLVLVANGSVALHLAYKALALSGEVITTPFSFVASAGTLAWDGIEPVFSDIDSKNWNINADWIVEKITSRTSAILPVHVFGNATDVDAIDHLSEQNGLKVIYDASHCFGAELRGQSLLEFGDVSTISFHATKLFHTVEGGAVVTKSPALAEKIRYMVNFGLDSTSEIVSQGTNAKMSEFHAAMGLAVLEEMEVVQSERSRIWHFYEKRLSGRFMLQGRHEECSNNYAYFPVLLSSEAKTEEVVRKGIEKGIQLRRYFYPSLNRVSAIQGEKSVVCPVSEDIASRIVCLPIWPGLREQDCRDVVRLIEGA